MDSYSQFKMDSIDRCKAAEQALWDSTVDICKRDDEYFKELYDIHPSDFDSPADYRAALKEVQQIKSSKTSFLASLASKEEALYEEYKKMEWDEYVRELSYYVDSTYADMFAGRQPPGVAEMEALVYGYSRRDYSDEDEFTSSSISDGSSVDSGDDSMDDTESDFY